MTDQTYTAKSAAIRAARKALGPEAIPSVDFQLAEIRGRWAWAEKGAGETADDQRPTATQIAAEHVAGEANHFKLNEAGQKAVRVARGGFPDPKATGAKLAQLERRESKDEPEVEAAKTRMSGKHKAALEAAQRGELPAAPDFSADTHKRFRPKLAEVVAAAQAGDLKALKAFEIKAISTSPKAIARYRDLAVIALEARANA